MKPSETKHKAKKAQSVIMWLCILYGGFAIILFAFDLYSAIWLGSSFLTSTQTTDKFDQNIVPMNDSNFPRDMNRVRPEGNGFAIPFRGVGSPASIMVLFSGLLSLAAGFTIWGLVRTHEIKKIKQETAEYLLLPDEKKIIEALKRNDYSLTQSKIVYESGLNKVQVHRVIKRLEAKGLLEKHDYGVTNKIVLKKELIE
ncbi:MAG: hypothetical protein AABW59_04585 [archaeon]